MNFVKNIALFVTASTSAEQIFSFEFLENFENEEEVNVCEDWIKNRDLNKEPVIGILSQTFDFRPHKDDHRFDNYKSYIMGAYVRFMESAGARVIPILFNDSEEQIKEKMEQVDAVLWPGGGGDYETTGKFVLKETMRLNDEGHFYPLWGTCLGFERLALYTAKDMNKTLEHFGSHHQNKKLKFTTNPKKTKMFCQMDELEIKALSEKNLTYNSHQFSLRPSRVFEDEELREFWDVTSISKNDNGTEFVASFESKKYPIMGTQFHPEKASQVFNDNYGIEHSWESISIMKYFARQLVEMARASPNRSQNKSAIKYIDDYDVIQTSYYAGDVYVFN